MSEVHSMEWMSWPSVRHLFDVFGDAGVDLLAVGGCVRDGLLGRVPHDVDFATSAPPDQTIQILKEAHIHAVPTGYAHGTVTAVIDGQSHEITSFRSDIDTDGRHATVAFTGSRAQDAQRRDFTMNALYMNAASQIFDDVGGHADALAGRVRFIGDPNARITEDYLRILRYFRFTARFAKTPAEPDTLDALRRHAQGLRAVSSERIGQEILQLFTLPAPDEAIAQMVDTGVAQAVFEVVTPDVYDTARRYEQALGLAPDPIFRLAHFTTGPLKERLRLSNAQAKYLAALRDLPLRAWHPAEIGHDWPAHLALYALAALRIAQGQEVSAQDQLDLQFGQDTSCPIKAKDLAGFYQGPALGAALKKAKSLWLRSKGALSVAQIIETLDQG